MHTSASSFYRQAVEKTCNVHNYDILSCFFKRVENGILQYMEFTQHDIEKLASLARIELSDEEKKRFGEQITSILHYVDQIQEVDTSDVEARSITTVEKNVFRKDKKIQCRDSNRSIDQFPERFGNLNKVKAVLGNGDEA